MDSIYREVVNTFMKLCCKKHAFVISFTIFLLLTRYLSEIDLVTQDFQQLVGGVLWLIRDGESYLEESIKIECSDTEETGERGSKYRMLRHRGTGERESKLK